MFTRTEPRRGRRLSLAANVHCPQGPLLVYSCHLEVCGVTSISAEQALHMTVPGAMQGDYDKAWGYLVEANRLQRETYLYDPQVHLIPALLHSSEG